MRNCWEDEAGERTSFRNLTMKFESMLADGSDYLDLNPNVVHNRTYFTNISDADVLFNNGKLMVCFFGVGVNHNIEFFWGRIFY